MFTEIREAGRILRSEGWQSLARKSFDYGLLRSARLLPLSRTRILQLSRAVNRHLYETDTSAYRAPLDPFKVEFVSPDEIERITARKGYPVWKGVKEDFGAVRGGDWDEPKYDLFTSEERARGAAADRIATPSEVASYCYLTTGETFSDSIIHRSMADHFLNGTAWEDTEAVRKTLRIIESGDYVWGGCSERQMRRRCREIDRLFESIKESGFQTQEQRLRQGSRPLKSFIDVLRDEILVDVGRDGELLFADGRHRLSIAKILDVDRIPVAFLVRHPRWMERRDNMYASGGRADHPDLRELHDGR
jgi:hypothetical protein